MYAYPELLETQNYFSDNQNENFNTSFEDETIKTIYQEPAPVRDYAPIEIMPPNKIPTPSIDFHHMKSAKDCLS